MTPEIAGLLLEARIQRLFLAQGIFAERGLKVAADRTGERIVTDVDVLMSEYASGFHVTRRHAECKSGKKFHPLDRVLWMRGVRHLLSADSSYFVVDGIDPEIASFARRIQIELWTVRHLEQLETALGIPGQQWPCRSDFAKYETAKARWLRSEAGGESPWRRSLREFIRFIEMESWLTPSYNRLNRLLRYFSDIGRLHGTGEVRAGDEVDSCRYVVSALLVRLAQYLIFVCFDVSVTQRSELRDYLSQRLAFGDQDVPYLKSLMENVVKYVRTSAESQGKSLPVLDPGRLMVPPDWWEPFTALVLRLLDSPNEARYVPVAMEATQFDTQESIKRYPRLQSAVRVGADLTALVKAFTVQAMSLPQEILEPIPAAKLIRQVSLREQKEQLELAPAELRKTKAVKRRPVWRSRT